MRPPGRHRDQRLPRTAGAASRGDVRLPVRRSAAGAAGTARRRHCPGEARMSAAKKQADAADTKSAPAAITLIEGITQAPAYEMRRPDERRVGSACGGTCRFWVMQLHYEKKNERD